MSDRKCFVDGCDEFPIYRCKKTNYCDQHRLQYLDEVWINDKVIRNQGVVMRTNLLLLLLSLNIVVVSSKQQVDCYYSCKRGPCAKVCHKFWRVCDYLFPSERGTIINCNSGNITSLCNEDPPWGCYLTQITVTHTPPFSSSCTPKDTFCETGRCCKNDESCPSWKICIPAVIGIIIGWFVLLAGIGGLLWWGLEKHWERTGRYQINFT